MLTENFDHCYRKETKETEGSSRIYNWHVLIFWEGAIFDAEKYIFIFSV